MRPWLNLNKVEQILQPETPALVLFFIFLSFAFYRVFLSKVSEERHRNLRRHYVTLVQYGLVALVLYFASWFVLFNCNDCSALANTKQYLFLATILSGIVVIVRWARLSVLQYLFMTSMKAGVPLLIVNIITLMLSILLAVWVANSLFGINLAPLVATSAVLSIILGIALQDSLGNLFAGLALQFEGTYSIGDWIEVQLPGQKTVGRVDEVTWRATVLVGWTDEQVTIPNRILSQSQINNFSIRKAPFVKSIVFRLNFDSDLDLAKSILLQVAESTVGISKDPTPLCLITENSESWVMLKLIYFIEDYGKQLIIADELMGQCLEKLKASGIQLAKQKLEISNTADQ